ncbi:phage tail tube protein [Microbacterium gilvum]
MVYLAPVGTPFPTDLAAPGSPWQAVGWLHTDGITETPTGSRTSIRGHQGNRVVRTRMEEPGTQIAFVALEDTPLTRGMRYDVKSSTTTSGVRREVRGAGQKITRWAAIIDKFDSDFEGVQDRDEIPRFEVAPDGDRVFVNNDIAAFPFLGEIVGDYENVSQGPEA